MTFEFKAPLMVARQHWKYVVGSDHTMDSWNESSRRYVTSDPDFYIPEPGDWRLAPENLKQGSAGAVGEEEGYELTRLLMEHVDQSLALYDWAMTEKNIAPEQARLFLPAYGMNVLYRWSCSLQSVGLFLKQRLHDTAQLEISEFAKAVQNLVEPVFPYSLKAIMENLDG
jgi:thymidylate synthase (FAD)